VYRYVRVPDPFESGPDFRFDLLDENSHRQAPDKSARPVVSLVLKAVPDPGTEDSHCLAEASGDSDLSIGADRGNRELALPRMNRARFG